ncbi:hypothetical protein [Mycolicibacterium murale]|uniref:hypothetical protein n=1 Tax=Mycolicibacterium murale TaxID=182220 RepID=UPI001873E3F7|nr:hypothetical protein [Mycolicibacterium murale]MCV7182950.1 hypothetical protein [Mycolicibacterium murale]
MDQVTAAVGKAVALFGSNASFRDSTVDGGVALADAVQSCQPWCDVALRRRLVTISDETIRPRPAVAKTVAVEVIRHQVAAQSSSRD